jgi:GAF domain
VGDILAALAAAGPASTWPDRLVEECRAATDMSGIGLAVTSAAGGGILAVTDGPARQMEDLQFALGEGPCVDASRTARPVLCPDLAADGSARWPAFGPRAGQAGVAAAFAFPLQVGAVGIGVLDLYRTERGALTGPQFGEAVAFADAAVAVLLHVQGRGEDGALILAGAGGSLPDWAEVLDRRAVVHQAAGMISVQLEVDVVVALVRLRAHAFAAGRPMVDVANDVVARRLRFDDSESGTTEGRPWRGPEGAPGEEP